MKRWFLDNAGIPLSVLGIAFAVFNQLDWLAWFNGGMLACMLAGSLGRWRAMSEDGFAPQTRYNSVMKRMERDDEGE